MLIDNYVINPDYIITFSPLSDEKFDNLPFLLRKEINRLFELTPYVPQETIPKLLKYKEQYPYLPRLYTYLYNAYLMTENNISAENIAFENYVNHPDYLFARISYASVLLKKNQLEKIPAIFNNKFDLKELYPNRKIFHISEYAGFADFLTIYYLEKNQLKEAEEILQNLKKIVAKHRIINAIEERLNEYKKKKKIV